MKPIIPAHIHFDRNDNFIDRYLIYPAIIVHLSAKK
jgi:hypothetical protein